MNILVSKQLRLSIAHVFPEKKLSVDQNPIKLNIYHWLFEIVNVTLKPHSRQSPPTLSLMPAAAGE